MAPLRPLDWPEDGCGLSNWDEEPNPWGFSHGYDIPEVRFIDDPNSYPADSERSTEENVLKVEIDHQYNISASYEEPIRNVEDIRNKMSDEKTRILPVIGKSNSPVFELPKSNAFKNLLRVIKRYFTE